MDKQVKEGITLPQSAHEALNIVDNLSPELRELVHDFGHAMIAPFLQAGISKASTIRMLIGNVYAGPRSTSINRSSKATGSPIAEHMDAALRASGSNMNFRVFLTLLRNYGFTIVPRQPSSVMVTASIEETGKMGLVNKEQKHRGRLRAAIEAAERRLWPWLANGKANQK